MVAVHGGYRWADVCKACGHEVEGDRCANPFCRKGHGECSRCGRDTPADVLFVTEAGFACDLCLTDSEDESALAGVIKSAAELG